MHKDNTLVAIFVVLMLGPGNFALFADEIAATSAPLLKINKEYDKRTAIKPSTVPGAGNGLFAVALIRKGELVGELGGRLVSAENYPAGNHYIAAIPECAWPESHPYKYLDSKDFGGHVSRMNFAPSKINGIETHFQNAAIRQLCHHPYFVFVALQDIKPGKEIWASYGAHYDYDRFMSKPEVRDYFCGLIKIDCHKSYSYEY